MARYVGTLWLAGLNALVLVTGTALAAWLLREEPATVYLPTPDTASTLPAPTPPAIQALREAPLFQRDRKPVMAVVAPVAVSTEPTAPPPVLVGLVHAGGEIQALLQDQTGKRWGLVRKGGSFEGWTLVGVGGKTVVLEQGGQPLEIALNPAQTQAGFPALAR